MMDLTAGASLLANQRDSQQAQRQQTQRQFMGDVTSGIGGVAKGMKEHSDEEKQKAALKAWGIHAGLDPNDPAWEDPETAKALIASVTEDKRTAATQAFQKWMQHNQQVHADEAQQAGFTHSDAAAKQQHTFSVEDAATELEQKRQRDTALGGEVSELNAPTISQESVDAADPDSPNFDPFAGQTQGPVGPEGQAARAAKRQATGRPFSRTAIESAGKLATSAQPKPVDPSLTAERDARAALLKKQTEDHRPTGGAASKVVTQAMIDAGFGIPQEALGEPSADWIKLNEGKANRGAADARQDKTIGAADARLTRTLAQRDQELQARLAEAAKKIDPAVMQRIVNARQRARDAAQNFDTKGAEKAMEEAEALIPGGAPAGDKGAGEEPTPEEMKQIEANPTVAASWKAWTPEQKKAYLDAVRKP